MATGITVLTTERFTLPSYTPLAFDAPSVPARRGTEVRVQMCNGDRMHFSRLDTEGDWHLDTHYVGRSSSFPRFHNGRGSRCTIPTLASDSLADLLDEAAQAVVGHHPASVIT